MFQGRVVRITTAMAVFAALAGCAAPQTQVPTVAGAAAEVEARKQRELVLENFVTMQSRLERVGVPILRAAVPFCEEKRRHTTGAWFWTRDVFPEDLREAATARYGATNLVQVGVVREGSPADAAGLKLGDTLVRVDEWEVPTGTDAFKIFLEHLQELLARPTAILRIPVNLDTRSGVNVDTDSGQSDHLSERSDAGV